jgi:hypothetical protein
MSKTITILNLQVKPSVDGLTDVVENVAYGVSATTLINNTEYSVNGGDIVTLPQPNPATFTPFESLTESEVVAWVEANADTDALVDRLIDQLEQQVNPPIITRTPPWES